MWTQKFLLDSLVIGATYVICGVVQATAGTVFLIMSSTILKHGSNVWTGLFTLLSGCFLLNISRQNKAKGTDTVIVGYHSGILLINVGNLLLMEINEWRAFLNEKQVEHFIRNGHITIFLVAYLSTTIPTVVAFVVSFLAIQYKCCILFSTKTSDDKKQLTRSVRLKLEAAVNINQDGNSRSMSGESRSSYDWVFQQTEKRSAIVSFKRTPPNHFTRGDLMMEPGFGLRTFVSPLNRNVPAILNPCNWSSLSDPESTMEINEANTSTPVTEAVPHQTLSKQSIITQDPDLSVMINDDVQSFDDKLQDERPIHDMQCRYQVSTQIVHSTNLPRSEWCLPSRPLHFQSIDSDSLIFLKPLELLARQWRIDHEHQKMQKKIAQRIAASSRANWINMLNEV